MAEGFLGRWSQRKQAVREGKPIEEPAVQPSVRPETAHGPAGQATGQDLPQAQTQGQGTEAKPPAEPPPTLQDVQALTPQSDFQRFVAPDVDPEVKHAAMRKLFSDPHFNVMDGMDVYIDDYNTPNPMPASMLRKMASAQFLGLVEDEETPQRKADAPAPAPVLADNAPPAGTTAEAMIPQAPSAAAPTPNTSETSHHADPDLRLQQDHAAGPQGSGGRAG